MNTKFVAASTTIVLVTGLRQPVAEAQVPQLVKLSSMFSSVLVQRSRKSLSLETQFALPPPRDEGIPDTRTIKATYNTDSLKLSRKINVLASPKEEPSPPTPSVPGGRRLAFSFSDCSSLGKEAGGSNVTLKKPIGINGSLLAV